MFLRGPLFSPLKAQNKETIQSWPFSICGACVVSCFGHVWLCDPMDDSPPGFSVHGISPNKNTGVGCHALLQRIFPTQGLNPCLLHLLHGQVDSLLLTPPGNSSALKSDARKCTIFCCSITLLSLFWIPHSSERWTPELRECRISVLEVSSVHVSISWDGLSRL